MRRLVIAVLAAAMAVAACSKGSSNGSAATTTTAAPATTTTEPPLVTVGALPTELDGTFSILLAASEVPKADEAGFWYLTLTRNYGYEFGHAPSDPRPNTGALTMDGSRLTMSNERGDGACAGPGVYDADGGGGALTFKVVNDDCDVRVNQMTAHAYTRCPAGPTSCVKPT